MKHPASYFSEHLLLTTSLAFVSGIALSPFWGLSETGRVLFFVLLFSLLVLLIALHRLKKAKTVLVLLIPLVFGIGCYHGYVHQQMPADENHIYNRINTKKDVVLIGTMATMAEFDGRTSQVTIEAKSLRFKENVNLLPTTGKVLLRLKGPWPDEISPGDTLAIRTDLKRPDSYRTPGVFDYAQFLARKDIWITGFVRTPLFLHKVEESRSLLHFLHYLPERLRTTIGKHIDASVSAETSGVYRAILIADRSQVTDQTLEAFKGSGTMHILAISGMHMAVIGTLLYVCIFWTLSRSEQLLLRFTLKKWAALLSLPVLIGYGLLAGMNTPVFRAVIMSSIVILAVCTNRQKSPGTLLAFAALLILAIDPLQLFTVSFQLSFSAIAGIFFLLPVLKKLLYPADESLFPSSINIKILKWIAAGLLVSLVANLATAPIALYSFNRFSTVGPLANLIIEPLICLWSLAAGFLSIPFIFIEPEISAFLLQSGSLGLDAAMRAATFFSSFSFSTIWLPTPPVWLVFLYFLSLIVFFFTCLKKNWWSLVSLLTLSVCILYFIHPPTFNQRGSTASLRISYLDVGQGSSTYIEFPSGFRVLIDGGGSSFTTTTVGERVIAPFLWKKGIQEIDAVIITHPDADHYNGLEFIIRHFSPRLLWVRDKEGHDSQFKRLIQLAEKQQVSVIIPEEGDLLFEGPQSLKCVANALDLENEVNISRISGNNGLVLKACGLQFCVLFPGDIGRNSEKALIDQGFDLNADVLLAPHHGSITSNSSQFLEAVSPDYLLVSAGRSTKGYFPHKGLAEECASRQISLFTTSAQGTLETIANGNGYQVYGYERGNNNNPLSSYNRVLLAEEGITPR
ncbi:MAG: DNA internalization-related competence protein ComEC/Rec2 [Desulforhopalus sp.]